MRTTLFAAAALCLAAVAAGGSLAQDAQPQTSPEVTNPAAEAAAAAQATADAPEVGAIVGQLVAQATDTPLEGSLIRLDGLNRSVTSSAYGRFLFPRLEMGTYTLSVYHEDEWFPYIAKVVINEPEPAVVKIELPVVVRQVEEKVVVTADRVGSELRRAPEAVTLLEREDLERFAFEDIASAIRTVPGINLQTGGGSEAEPALNVRGFTGGGENDYLLVLVDGVRVNGFNDARVDWREIPLSEVERIEVVRGPVSALWGDTAAGGVVQIFTRKGTSKRWSAGTHVGSFGESGLQARVSRREGTIDYQASIGYEQGDGWRNNGDWEDIQARVRLGREGERRSWSVTGWVRSDDHGNPGPLSATQAETDPEVSATPLDRLERQRAAVSWQERRQASDWTLNSQISMRVQQDEQVQTIVGSTTTRELEGLQLWGESRVERDFGLDGQYATTFGVETSYIDYDATLTGANESDGTGDRVGLAAYAQLRYPAGRRVEFLGGLRYDRLDDTFEAVEPGATPFSTVVFNGSQVNDAVSPRVAVLFQLSEDATLFANAGRSFKAPTPFQLFDRRQFFGFPITNPGLEPQRGNSASAGYRHHLEGFDVNMDIEATVYVHDLEDEIGFDPVAFRTINIGESRHRGYEVNLNSAFLDEFTAQFGYSFTDAQIRIGEFTGNQIDNVPQQIWTLGVGWKSGPWTASGLLREVSDIYLDSGNQVPLEDYRTVDATVTRTLPFDLQARLEIRNLLDEEYASWGFINPLPPFGPQVYPGLERSFFLGVSYRPEDDAR